MEKIATLHQASQVLLSTFDLDEVLAGILNIVRENFDLSYASVLLLDSSSRLYIRQQIGHELDSSEIRLPLGTGITGTAAQTKKPLNVADVREDRRYVHGPGSTRSELAIPLLVRNQTVGVLDIQSVKTHAFDGATVAQLTTFSMQASIAIENARLYSLVQQRATQLEAINAIARQTTALLEMNELLPKVCKLVQDHFAAANVAVYLKEKSNLYLRAHLGATPPSTEELARIAFATGEVEAHNTDLNANTAHLSPQAFPPQLCLPLIFYGEKLGVLCLESEQAGNFSELDPLLAVADIFAAAIKNCQQFELAKQLAYRDGLTGIFNRRFFEERILEEVERATRYNSELAVLMIDIDQFKGVNDSYGHLLGDEVLKLAAQLFLQQLRKSDIVCRFGGEEFVILLPQLGRDRVVEVAQKLRRIVQSCPFPGIGRPITVSIGVAHLPGNGSSRDELMADADAALYTAKQLGRNRVALAEIRDQMSEVRHAKSEI